MGLPDFFMHLTLFDVVDVAIVAILLVKLFGLIKETRAEQLIKGIFALLVLTKISELLHLYTIQWILTNVMSYGILLIIIMFQPELRRGLEHIGRSRVLRGSFGEIGAEASQQLVQEIVRAALSLSRQQMGAIIVMERHTGLNEIVDTGTKIDGNVTTDLLINIFIPNTPLHDGAVIIKNDRIKAAACFLPLTENKNLSRDLGTRHRAALGISEKSDCIAVVVSEETGVISIAENGVLKRHIDEKTLAKKLMEIYSPTKNNRSIVDQLRRRHDEEKE
ncbi:MAG: TIGR00159 family protein [Tissierellia bacterium]|nr:TIGR00159 family protein [Tissierellia bacterium]